MKQTRLLRLELNEVPPREFRVFPYGVIETTKGIFIFDERAAEQVMAAWRDYGNDLVIDYEHQTFEPAGNGPVPAAGWFGLELRDDGLWAVSVRWTERAAEALKAREYRYMSPAFEHDDEGRITRLYNVALVNFPATKAMEPLAAGGKKTKEHVEGGSMKGLLKLLGLGDGASEAEAAEAVSKLKDTAQQLEKLTGKQNTEEALAVVMAWKEGAGQTEKLAARVKELEAEQRKAELSALVQKGLDEGKLTPALKGWAMTLSKEALEAYLSAAPQIVKLGKEVEPGKEGVAALDGKKWEDLKPIEKHNLYLENPELFAALKADYEARKGGK